jgi:integrase
VGGAAAEPGYDGLDGAGPADPPRRAAGAADGTINRELAVLSAALSHARTELEWDAPDPVRGRAPRPGPGRLRWITREEAARLIAAAGQIPQAPHLPDLIRLALHTGMRRGELLGLEWSRVDFGGRLIYLDTHHTKTGARRAVPINAEAWAALRSRWDWRAEHCPETPWVFAHGDDKHQGEPIRDVKHAFTSACRAAGITDFRFHDLRHTCASWLIQSGASLSEVAAILGHTTIRMAERYAHLAPESARAALARLDPTGADERQIKSDKRHHLA